METVFHSHIMAHYQIDNLEIILGKVKDHMVTICLFGEINNKNSSNKI